MMATFLSTDMDKSDQIDPLENQNPNRRSHLIIPITVLGLVLRLININQYSFWSDEAGQFNAAIQPKLSNFLDLVNSHVMAMPLDYLVTRWVAKFSLEEGILRLPAALWGTLAILFFFLSIDIVLRNHPYGRQTALFASLILAISPVHIFYSQELRFYAALLCFYWLTTYFLLRFMRRQGFSNLFLLSIFGLIGVFFHPYVLLAGVNGLLFLLFRRKIGLVEFGETTWGLGRTIAGLIGSAVVILTGFLLWFFVQEPNTLQNHELLQFTGSLQSFLLSGLGWRGYEWCDNSTLFGPWEFFLVVSFLIGTFLLFRDKQQSSLTLPLLLAYIIQVSLVILAAYLRGYWVAMRQVIHLAPLLFVVNAFGISTLVHWLSQKRLLGLSNGKRKIAASMLAVALLIGFASPKIFEYYKVSKSNAEEIVDILLQASPTVDQVLVNPGYNAIVYEIYFSRHPEFDNVKMLRVNLDSLVAQSTSGSYLIAPVQLTFKEKAEISEFFDLVYIPPGRCWGDRALYISR